MSLPQEKEKIEIVQNEVHEPQGEIKHIDDFKERIQRELRQQEMMKEQEPLEKEEEVKTLYADPFIKMSIEEIRQKIKQIYAHPDYENNIRYLALTLWGEGRSCNEEEKILICDVILTRLTKYDKYSNVKEVVMAENGKQFNCWKKTDPNYDKMFRAEITFKENFDMDLILAYKMWVAFQKGEYQLKRYENYITYTRFREIFDNNINTQLGWVKRTFGTPGNLKKGIEIQKDHIFI